MAHSRGGSPYEPGSANGSYDPSRAPRPQGPDPYAVDVYLSTTGPHRPPRGADPGASRSGAHRAVNPAAASGSHRRRAGGRGRDEGRRGRKRKGRLGLAGVAAGVVGIGVVAASIFLLRSGGGGHGTTGGGQADDGYPRVPAPATGTVLSVATPDGFTYGIGGIKGGVTTQPLSKGGTPPPPGGAFAYGDYVLSNTGNQPALIDFTAVDLFVKTSDIPADSQARCMPQPGTPPDMCTLPNTASVQAVVNGSKAPVNENGQPYLPPGSKAIIRLQTTLPVLPSTTQQDMSFEVWQVRYIANRKAVPVPFA